MPTRLEFPHVRSFGDLGFVVGCEIPLVFIHIAFPEIRGFVIVWSVIIVEQFEGRETTLYAHG